MAAPRAANKELPYSVDALFSAINKGRMVQFRYKKVGRPETRTISPWQMVWENGCYYLIAYQDEKSPAGIQPLPGGQNGRRSGAGRSPPGQGAVCRV